MGLDVINRGQSNLHKIPTLGHLSTDKLEPLTLTYDEGVFTFSFQTDKLDAFDFDCDEAPSVSVVLMAKLSSYDSNILSKVPIHNNYLDNHVNDQIVQEMLYYEQPVFNNDTYIDITSDSNMISYEQYLKETENTVVQDASSFAQQEAMIMSVIEEMNNQVAKCNEVADFKNQIHSLKLQLNATIESHKTLLTTVDVLKMESKAKEDKYLEEIIELEKKKKSLDNVHDALSIIDTKETLELDEESRLKMHAKQNDPIAKEKNVNIAPIDYVALNKLSEHFVKHFVPQKQLVAEQAFWLPISKPVSEIPPVQPEPVLKEIPSKLPTISLVKESFNKMRNHVNDFENVVIVRTKVTGQNVGSWGIEHMRKAFEKDVKPFVNTLKDYFQIMEKSFLNEYSDCVELKAELTKKNEMVEKAVALEFPAFFEINDLKVQLEAKNNSISKLKDHIATVKGKGVSKSDKSENTSKVIALGMYKLDLEPLSPKFDSGSKPLGNTKKNRISRPTSSNKTNKVEDHLRSVKSSLNKKNHVSKPVCNENVKHSMLNANSELVFTTCNECRTFIVDGNTCPLTRITSNPIVPPKETNQTPVITSNPEIKVYYVEGLGHNLFSVGQLCDSDLEVAFRKRKKYTYKPKSKDLIQQKLYLLHMDLCGPMRIESINEKKYIVVIVDDYLRFTWVKFLLSKMLQANYDDVRISYQTLVARTPQQNNIVEIQNRTLVEAARTMLIFSKVLLFLWAKAVAIACYTQNRSLICKHHNKTPYELLHDKKPDLTYFHVFGALCYPTNDSEDLGKLKPKADIGIFVSYAPTKKAF
ncbi:retrovirus-related pol polyprotein from transposon TNT 1-94 [Tanacetum coccineum]